MGNTSISWTNKTWNPIRGCSRVSAGCQRCYAERVAARFSGPGQPYEGLALHPASLRGSNRSKWTGEVRLVPEHLADPLRWKAPRRIFVNSMSDLFHEKLTNEQIAAVFGVMAAAPQHAFQVLTKRARRMREWFEMQRGGAIDIRERLDRAACEWLPAPDDRALLRARDVADNRWPLPNVWLGVSVENQEAADERIPELLRTPAAVRFLSCEPLLGPVTLDDVRPQRDGKDACSIDALRAQEHLFVDDAWSRNRIDWVIAGCESGPGARPCSVEWLRSLRDQCAEASVPFFLKQATQRIEPGSYPKIGSDHIDVVGAGPGSKRKSGGVIELPYLDGVQHAAFPEDRP